MGKIRCFISIDIPENVCEEIKQIQESLPDFRGKKTEQENLHLTLKFLGEIEDSKVEEVKNKLREINFSKFETDVDKIEVFDNRKSGKYSRKIIVWLRLTNCERLQKEIDEVLSEIGFRMERRFMGHLTIARVKKVRDKKEFLESLNKIKIPKIKFAVESFRLKKSTLTREGPVYDTIEEYMLM